MMTKFRQQRGGFAESMDTVEPACTFSDLKAIVQRLGFKGLNTITVGAYSIVDKRNGWETHVVSVDGKAFGFTDGMPEG